MAFTDFNFPQVLDDLRLNIGERNLFGTVAAMPLSADFVARVRAGAELAWSINTEKARSEFIIAPLLLELRTQFVGRVSVFSGIEFDVDSSRGLNGVCDFLLSRSKTQIVQTAPVVAIAEAKNDNIRGGLGKCIASMVAAREFNRKAGSIPIAVFGATTTGSAWKFLQLIESNLTVDIPEYYIDDPGRILGILVEMARGDS